MSQWTAEKAGEKGLAVVATSPLLRSLSGSSRSSFADASETGYFIDVERSAKRRSPASDGRYLRRILMVLQPLVYCSAAIAFILLINHRFTFDRSDKLLSRFDARTRLARLRSEYYDQPGMMVVNERTSAPAARARYISMNRVDALANGTWGPMLDGASLNDGWDDLMLLRHAADANLNKEGKRLPAALEHLRNKTIVLVGDSVDRYFVDGFCNDMMTGFRLSHRALHEKPNDLSGINNDNDSWEGKDFTDFAEPHLCELPAELGGMKIWSLMHYGVLTQDEDEWAFKKQARSPRLATKKVTFFADKLTRHGYRTPDLVVVNSGLWDLATSNIQDVRASRPSAHYLDATTLKEIQRGNKGLLRTIAETWPQAKMMYRTLHTVEASSGAWFLNGLPLIGGKPFKQIDRQPYAHNKVAQLNAAIAFVQASRDVPLFDLFDLGRVTQGYTEDFTDDVHLREAGLSLYAQMLMHSMRRYFADIARERS